MNDKYKIIAIMGKAGSGKDSLCHTLLNLPELSNAQPIISCTTRPIRDYECDGVDYYFITNHQFTEQVLNGEMLEATAFNNWCYGTSIKSLNKDKINIGVFNPEGVEYLQENTNIDLQVIYITANDKVRLLRQLNREENPDCHEIVRRFGTDEKDFSEGRIAEIRNIIKIKNDGDISLLDLAKSILPYILGKTD